MVAKFDPFCFVSFGTDRLRCEEAMKNRWEKTLKSLGHYAQQPSAWGERSEQISLDQVGCEARQRPATVGDVFFLDFCLYRTHQALAKSTFRRGLLGEPFPPFRGTSTEGAILDGWGPLEPRVCLGKHRVTPVIDASL